MDVSYTPAFLRQFYKLPVALQDEVDEKVTLFANEQNHKLLKVHKLKGRLAGKYSFSVNYRYRVVFIYLSKKKNIIALVAVGDHNVYR